MNIKGSANYRPHRSQPVCPVIEAATFDAIRAKENSKGEKKIGICHHRKDKCLDFCFKFSELRISLPKHKHINPGHQYGRLQVGYRYRDEWVPQLPRRGSSLKWKEFLLTDPMEPLVYKALYSADLLGYDHPIARLKYFEFMLAFWSRTPLEPRKREGRAKFAQLYLDMIVEDLLMSMLSPVSPDETTRQRNPQASIFYRKQPLVKLIKDRPHHDYTIPEALQADQSWILELA